MAAILSRRKKKLTGIKTNNEFTQVASHFDQLSYMQKLRESLKKQQSNVSVFFRTSHSSLRKRERVLSSIPFSRQ